MLFATYPTYEERCDALAREMRLYDSVSSFCRSLPSNVCPVLVTAGVREIWAKALSAAGLGKMSVIAGNHSTLHNYIISDEAKGLVARELRRLHPGCQILSFGDSELDIPMMNASDRSFVVLDSRRNVSMTSWIQQNRLNSRVFQVSPHDTFTWHHDGMRVCNLESLKNTIVREGANATLELVQRSMSLQLLADQSRQADLSGPPLQEIHRKIGRCLALTLLDEYGTFMDLVESTAFPHVQGSMYEAFIPASRNVAIVPLMRGGEPMSRGVFEMFPGATLIHHSSEKDDAFMDNLCRFLRMNTHDEGPNGDRVPVNSVILVDSVINRGNSIRHVLREMDNRTKTLTIRSCQVFVLSGVTQLQAAKDLPREFPRVRFLTLRISRNQFTGKGGTDTGNRLFGTIL